MEGALTRHGRRKEICTQFPGLFCPAVALRPGRRYADAHGQVCELGGVHGGQLRELRHALGLQLLREAAADPADTLEIVGACARSSTASPSRSYAVLTGSSPPSSSKP